MEGERGLTWSKYRPALDRLLDSTKQHPRRLIIQLGSNTLYVKAGHRLHNDNVRNLLHTCLGLPHSTLIWSWTLPHRLWRGVNNVSQVPTRKKLYCWIATCDRNSKLTGMTTVIHMQVVCNSETMCMGIISLYASYIHTLEFIPTSLPAVVILCNSVYDYFNSLTSHQ